MIRAVIFDWGGVITRQNIARSFCGEVASINHLPYAKVRRAFNKNDRAYLLGKMEGREFFDSFADLLSIKRDYLLYRRLLIRYGTPQRRMLFLAEKLRKRYKTAVISDNYEELVSFVERRYPLQRIFDVLVFSNRVQVKKPHKAIFQLAVMQLRVKPAQCLFIDDIRKNVWGARRAGMNSLLFTSYAKLKKDLNKVDSRI